MRLLADSAVTWILVGLGGAAGSALGWYLARVPSSRRLLGVALICGLFGAVSAYPRWPVLNSVVGVGVLGSAASMVLLSMPPSAWLGTDLIGRTTMRVARRLAIHCAVAVTFALFGYLALRGGMTLYVKLR